MTENSQKVLNFLQQHPGEEFSYQDLVEECDVEKVAVVGAVNGFKRKGFVSERVESFAPIRKYDKPYDIKWFQITEAGVKFDPIQEERRKKREALEAAALRKKARQEEKAERARRNSVL